MFEWNAAYETGLWEIDQQHQELFRIGKEVTALLEGDSGKDQFDEIAECLERLAEYTVYHFDTEEELFSKYDYPQRDEHTREHQGFINYLNRLDLHDVDDHQQDALIHLLRFMSQWIFRHISSSDFQYVEYLKDCLATDVYKESRTVG